MTDPPLLLCHLSRSLAVRPLIGIIWCLFFPHFPSIQSSSRSWQLHLSNVMWISSLFFTSVANPSLICTVTPDWAVAVTTLVPQLSQQSIFPVAANKNLLEFNQNRTLCYFHSNHFQRIVNIILNCLPTALRMYPRDSILCGSSSAPLF